MYDAFTINVITHFEELGLCAPGEGGPLIEGGALRPGGSIPATTSGAGSPTATRAALGLLLLIEAVRQLRGECGERQLPTPGSASATGWAASRSAPPWSWGANEPPRPERLRRGPGRDGLRDALSRPFWAGAAEGRLLVQRCTACGAHQFYPRPFCLACQDEVEWVEASGRGEIYSLTTNHLRMSPELEPPYYVALVRLEEGPVLLTRIVDAWRPAR